MCYILIPVTPRSTHQRLRCDARQLNTALSSDPEAGKVTYSIGAATFTASPKTAAEVLSVADDLMYQAKSAGKSRVLQANISDEITQSPK